MLFIVSLFIHIALWFIWLVIYKGRLMRTTLVKEEKLGLKNNGYGMMYIKSKLIKEINQW